MVFTVRNETLDSFCSFFSFTKIVTFCQDWIVNNVSPPEEVVGSLAVQMKQRALDQERVRAFSLSLSFHVHVLLVSGSTRERNGGSRTRGRTG